MENSKETIEAFANIGLTPVDTGGRCKALGFYAKDMSHVLVTDAFDGSSIPDDGGDCDVGLYDKDGEMIEIRTMLCLANAIACAAEFKARIEFNEP